MYLSKPTGSNNPSSPATPTPLHTHHVMAPMLTVSKTCCNCSLPFFHCGDTHLLFQVNAAFAAIFNAMGIYPLIYAALLIPAARSNKVRGTHCHHRTALNAHIVTTTLFASNWILDLLGASKLELVPSHECLHPEQHSTHTLIPLLPTALLPVALPAACVAVCVRVSVPGSVRPDPLHGALEPQDAPPAAATPQGRAGEMTGVAGRVLF